MSDDHNRNDLPVAEVLKVLRDVEEGRDALTIHREDDLNPEFKTASGYVICVFDDCGGWDYLEWVTAPDGRRWDGYMGWGSPDADLRDDDQRAADNYDPKGPLLELFEQVSRKFWGLP